MARPLRIEYDGGLYHITSRGNERKAIFKDAGDRQLFLRILAQLTEHCHWICHAYCLMNNHYHLVIETPDGNLSKGMRRLNGVYTQAFNRRHHRVGHLFQGRFKAILVQKESHYLAGYRLHACRARRLFRKPPLTAAQSSDAKHAKRNSGCGVIANITSHFSKMAEFEELILRRHTVVHAGV